MICSDKLDIMDGHKSRVFSICSHPSDSNVFLSGGWDDTVQFWDVRQTRATRLWIVYCIILSVDYVIYNTFLH